jgi:hypothetical protein
MTSDGLRRDMMDRNKLEKNNIKSIMNSLTLGSYLPSLTNSMVGP